VQMYQCTDVPIRETSAGAETAKFEQECHSTYKTPSANLLIS